MVTSLLFEVSPNYVINGSFAFSLGWIHILFTCVRYVIRNPSLLFHMGVPTLPGFLISLWQIIFGFLTPSIKDPTGKACQLCWPPKIYELVPLLPCRYDAKLQLKVAVSEASVLSRGVPQGSTIAQMLFFLYINDLANCLNVASAKIFAHARHNKQLFGALPSSNQF